MKKIVYCIHSLHNAGGMERVLTLKANYLADILGYDVCIIASGLKGRKPYFPLSGKVRVKDLLTNENNPLQRLSFKQRLRKALEEEQADICISLGGREIFMLPDLRDGSVKIAEFHFSHEKYFMKYGKSAIGRLYSAIRTRQLEKAAGRLETFVVLTQADKRDWEKKVASVQQIYNPLTFRCDSPAPLLNKRCIAAGRLEAQKNFKDLIEAWGLVNKRHPDWSLDIFGKGKQHDALALQIEKTGLTGKVKLKGHAGDMRKELSESSCLVMSSRFEGFPMVLLEASAAGLPMVAYDCPKGPSEIIKDGENGYLVPVGDCQALAERICRIIEDDTLRYRMGTSAASNSKNFTIDRIMARWDALFKGYL